MHSGQHHYSPDERVPIEGVIKSGWRDVVVELDKDGQRESTVNYEISVLQAPWERLRKEIWLALIVGTRRDLPADFEAQREIYYQALKHGCWSFHHLFTTENDRRTDPTESGFTGEFSRRILSKGNGWIRSLTL